MLRLGNGVPEGGASYEANQVVTVRKPVEPTPDKSIGYDPICKPQFDLSGSPETETAAPAGPRNGSDQVSKGLEIPLPLLYRLSVLSAIAGRFA
jgi:hypothetical protein